MKYFLGIDGGGTQTKAVVINDTLEVVGRGVAGPSNHYRVGAEQAANNCFMAADLAVQDANRLAPQLRRDLLWAWGFGLAGVRREKDVRIMRTELIPMLGKTPWVLDTDAAAAHSGAFAGDSGIMLSAGTGAVCYGVDDVGKAYYSDGWGPLLGDEGSGYWIGLEALRAICRAHDGRAPRTRLAGAVLRELHIADMDQLVSFIHSQQNSTDKIAGLSRVVMDMAENGSQMAVEIRDRAVGHLAVTIASVAHAMLVQARDRAATYAGAQPAAPLNIPIALRGGLFEDDFFRASVGYRVGELMVEMKRGFLPLSSWKIVRPQYDAAFGAALMAQKVA